MGRPRCAGVARLVAGAWLVGLLAIAPPLGAHIIPGASTLSQLTRAASVVAVAKIVNPARPIEVGEAKIKRFVVEAEILEVLRGDVAKGVVQFVPHGHGAEAYEAGEEALIFLQPIEQSRELAGTKIASAVRFAGIDEVTDRITLRPASRGAFLDAARAYAAIFSKPADAQDEALRQATIRMLAANEPRLASFALKDLAFAGADSLIKAEDAPALLSILNDASRPLSLRVGLLTELERRKLASGSEPWVKLLREAPPAELATVARVAGKRALPEVTAELVQRMEGDNPQVASAAAAALGAPGNEAAVEPLGRAAWSQDPKLRWTALQSLGRIATPSARALLARAASEHFDANAQRAAQTEINLLATREAALAANGTPRNQEPQTPQSFETSESTSFVFRTHWKTLVIVGVIIIVAGLLAVRWRAQIRKD